MRQRKNALLTEAELELMTVLWKNGEGTVRQVKAFLPPSRMPAYTTVSTILRILVHKQLIATRKHSRAHIYSPLLSKAEYVEHTVRHLIDKVFDGDTEGLLAQVKMAAIAGEPADLPARQIVLSSGQEQNFLHN